MEKQEKGNSINQVPLISRFKEIIFYINDILHRFLSSFYHSLLFILKSHLTRISEANVSVYLKDETTTQEVICYT